MREKKVISDLWTIEILFGSEYQRKVWGEMFETFVRSFTTMAAQTHDYNIVGWRRDIYNKQGECIETRRDDEIKTAIE